MRYNSHNAYGTIFKGMRMKKVIAEFIVTLLVLVAALGLGAYVIKVTVDNGGVLPVQFTSPDSGDGNESTSDASLLKKLSLKKTESRTDTVTAAEPTGTIFIGDSRFVGMDDAVDIEAENNQFVVAQVGEGLSWFKNAGLRRVKKLREENSALTHWRYVICLGVNDLSDIKNYMEEYDTLQEDPDVELILVSVNPVKNYPTISNDDIESFNEKLSDYADENGLQYIDTYRELADSGFSSTDGLHYSNSTYEKIYDIISDAISGSVDERSSSRASSKP